MTRGAGRWTGMWLTDRGLTALLVFLGVTVFVLGPIRELGSVGHFVIGVLLSLALVSGVLAVARSPLIVVVVGGFALATVAMHWVALARPSTSALVIDAAGLLISFAVLAVLVLLQVFREGPITFHRIQGAVAVYLLIGLVWGFAYKIVVLQDASAFSGLRPGSSTEDLSEQLTYFSYVTLTTVGYGDITAVHPLARSLAMVEALVGQLFPAILIARLVSMELFHREELRARREARHTQLESEAHETSGEDRETR